jgi:hypothetical protein
MRRLTRTSALVVWLVAITCQVAALALGSQNNDSLLSGQGLMGPLLLVGFGAQGATGVLLVRRRPENTLGWILLGPYLAMSILLLAAEYAQYALVSVPGQPGGVLAAWFAGWMWYPALAVPFVFVLLCFPTGRPPTRRWRLVGWLGAAGIALTTGVAAFAETLVGEHYAVANPIGIAGLVAEQGPIDAIGFALVTGAVVGAAASLVVRFRRSRGDERQQLKWMVFAGGLLALLVVTDSLPLPEAFGLVFPVAVAMVPVAIAVAVLRYRLYEIDRLISRTVAYALVTVVLSAVYVTGVIVLTPALATVGGGSELAVAASTLAAAAAFGPVRRRVQDGVDRRFNRARYDAERTLAAFAGRLRDEVDLGELRADLVGVVDGVMQPASASLWLRPGWER